MKSNFEIKNISSIFYHVLNVELKIVKLNSDNKGNKLFIMRFNAEIAQGPKKP